MDLASFEALILARFNERCRRAGSFAPGYGMRKDAIAYGFRERNDLAPALDALVEKGWLKKNVAGTWYYLTEEGVERVKEA
jgi:butyrate kinase